ncbi:MAG: hypothetical protein U0N62_05130, partial [Hydrogeniiclostridium sp.]
KPAAASNKLCSIRTLNGVYTEFGIDPKTKNWYNGYLSIVFRPPKKLATATACVNSQPCTDSK